MSVIFPLVLSRLADYRSGNLRVETQGATTVNVQLENSYLLDTSDTVVDWITASGYNIIDVNVLKQIPTAFDPVSSVIFPPPPLPNPRYSLTAASCLTGPK